MNSINHPGVQTKMYYRIKEAGNDPMDRNAVAKYFQDLAKKRKDIIKIRLRDYEKDWRKIEKEFFVRTDNFFETNETMDNLIACLTFTGRCGYSIEKKLFFVTIGSDCPNSTIMHETLHFYTYVFLKPIFDGKNINYPSFNAFKEALTFVMNHLYQDLIPGHYEEGYEMHEDVTKYLESKYRSGMKAKELADIYIEKFCIQKA